MLCPPTHCLARLVPGRTGSDPSKRNPDESPRPDRPATPGITAIGWKISRHDLANALADCLADSRKVIIPLSFERPNGSEPLASEP